VFSRICSRLDAKRAIEIWDTSALVPLFVEEATSRAMEDLFAIDEVVAVSVLTLVEATSAIGRRHRQSSDMTESRALLESLSSAWIEVELNADVRRVAIDLLFRHPLKAADALQLATAIVASTSSPASLPFVTLDQTLAEAARAEGFVVQP